MTAPPGPSFNARLAEDRERPHRSCGGCPGRLGALESPHEHSPQVSPTGRRITWTSDHGRIQVPLTDGSVTRTLLSARGFGEFTYGLGAAFCAPDYEWIAADDGRVLVITPDHPAVTRVLTDETQQAAFEPQYARFAITASDVLTTTP